MATQHLGYCSSWRNNAQRVERGAWGRVQGEGGRDRWGKQFPQRTSRRGKAGGARLRGKRGKNRNRQWKWSPAHIWDASQNDRKSKGYLSKIPADHCFQCKIPPPIPPPRRFRQTFSVNANPLDLFDQPLLLDMIFLGTPQLCGGLDILLAPSGALVVIMG